MEGDASVRAGDAAAAPARGAWYGLDVGDAAATTGLEMGVEPKTWPPDPPGVEGFSARAGCGAGLAGEAIGPERQTIKF